MEKEKTGTRCFIAIDLPKGAVEEIIRVQKLIKKKKLFDGKIIEEENLHLTLKFLGEIDGERAEDIRKRLKNIKFNEFECRLGDIGVFSKRFVKIIWIKLNGKGVFDLQKEIDKKLRDIFPEEQRFMSHITIARVKRVYDKKGFLEYIDKTKIPKLKFVIDRFYLKKSNLFESGPVYEDLEEYKSPKEKI
jgi:RNA 2',3'-cyclic 3'-phosphodiesterase